MSEGPALSKGPDAFRTISEVAEELDLPQHVLRFWETRFSQIRPMKRGGGRRYYRPDDVELLRGIRRLLYGEGYTIKGVQRILKEQGPRQVVAAGHGGSFDPLPSGVADDDDFYEDVPEGILVDRDSRPGRTYDSPAVTVRREPPVRGAASASERREPVFGTPTRDAAPPVIIRPPGDRATEAGGVHPTPPPAVSRIPAAPPDEPDSADVYLPPAPTPPVPERVRGASRFEEAAFPYAGEPRRDPSPMPHAPPPFEDEPLVPSRLSEFGRFKPMAGESDEAVGSGPDLSASDMQLLQAALQELLECKRILDQSR